MCNIFLIQNLTTISNKSKITVIDKGLSCKIWFIRYVNLIFKIILNLIPTPGEILQSGKYMNLWHFEQMTLWKCMQNRFVRCVTYQKLVYFFCVYFFLIRNRRKHRNTVLLSTMNFSTKFACKIYIFNQKCIRLICSGIFPNCSHKQWQWAFV